MCCEIIFHRLRSTISIYRVSIEYDKLAESKESYLSFNIQENVQLINIGTNCTVFYPIFGTNCTVNAELTVQFSSALLNISIGISTCFTSLLMESTCQLLKNALIFRFADQYGPKQTLKFYNNVFFKERVGRML